MQPLILLLGLALEILTLASLHCIQINCKNLIYLLTCTSQMVVGFRSSAGYTPLDFAFVVAGDKGKDVVEMLDSDHQLLPRDTDPHLEDDIIEVWKQQKIIESRYYIVLPIPL